MGNDNENKAENNKQGKNGNWADNVLKFGKNRFRGRRNAAAELLKQQEVKIDADITVVKENEANDNIPPFAEPQSYPAPGWFEWLANGASTAWYQIERCYESVFPIRNSYMDAQTAQDREILRRQRLNRDLRNDLDLAKISRSATVKKNFKNDIAEVQQKVKICQNWYEGEADYLQGKRIERDAVNPQIGTEYRKTFGWDVQLGDSDSRGQRDLCEQLRCDSVPFQTQAVNCDPYSSKIDELLVTNAQLKQDKSIMKQNLNQYADFIKYGSPPKNSNARLNNYAEYGEAYDDRNIWNNPNSQQQEYVTRYYKEQPQIRINDNVRFLNDAPVPVHVPVSIPMKIPVQSNQLLGEGGNLSKFINLVFLPSKVSNSNSVIWEQLWDGTVPNWILRQISCLVLWTIETSFRYMENRQKLPVENEFSEYEDFKKQKRKKQKQKKGIKPNLMSGFVEPVTEQTAKIINWIRGGGTVSEKDYLTSQEQKKTLSKIDPIFIWIRMEKMRLEIGNTNFEKITKNQNRKIQVPSIKIFKTVGILSRSKEFLGYLGLTALTIGNAGRVTTSRFLTSSSQIVTGDYLMEKTYKTEEQAQQYSTKVKVGDSVLDFRDLPETLQKKNALKQDRKINSSNSKISKTRTAKVARFSDLPRLKEFEGLDEILKEYGEKYTGRIRIK
jgi:hypothetical protein